MTKSKSKKQDDETKQTDESNNTSSSTTRKKTRKRKPKVDEQSQQLQKQPIQIVSGEFPDKLTSIERNNLQCLVSFFRLFHTLQAESDSPDCTELEVRLGEYLPDTNSFVAGVPFEFFNNYMAWLLMEVETHNKNDTTDNDYKIEHQILSPTIVKYYENHVRSINNQKFEVGKRLAHHEIIIKNDFHIRINLKEERPIDRQLTITNEVLFQRTINRQRFVFVNHHFHIDCSHVVNHDQRPDTYEIEMEFENVSISTSKSIHELATERAIHTLQFLGEPIDELLKNIVY